MKFVGIVAAAAALTFATSANAFELGNGLSVGGEVESSYNFGTEDFGVLFTPEAAFNMDGLALGVSTEFDLANLEDEVADNFKGLDFEATYTVNDWVSAYGEISTDKDFEFGDLVVGTRFNF